MLVQRTNAATKNLIIKSVPGFFVNNSYTQIRPHTKKIVPISQVLVVNVFKLL